MNEREKNIAQYCDGVRTSKEIALLSGDNQKYVQRTMLKFDLPRLPQAPRTGVNNPSYKSGRRVDRDGYVLVSAPLGHPHARSRKGRKYGIIYEHRLILEDKIGRFLDPLEVVDHIDGLRLHNSPDNLRLFSSNAEHLRQTITGQVPNWSADGKMKLKYYRQVKGIEPVRNYQKMKVSGDARLRQILLAALQLGIDSPYLLGTSHHLEKAGISDFSRSNLERELSLLYRKYE
jgi:hypothetical protein